EGKTVTVGTLVLREGDIITIDGATGRVIPGDVPKVEPRLSPEFRTLLTWADGIRSLGVRANADTPEDAAKARELGAEGIGLCRTEHMFMAQDRLPVVQEMIMAETSEERKGALSRLLPMQQGDFEGIFRAMQGFPVTIRLLDPPLHEFLPDREELLEELANLRGRGASAAQIKEKEDLLRKARSLAEANPMLGFRGCRLGLVYPEIYEMQVRAIFQAAVRLLQEGTSLVPEVMLPLVGHVNELKVLKERIIRVAEEVMAETGQRFHYLIGTMIEVPRAALTAGEIAREAEFFSFGTNDLTQTTFGFSRDDAEARFLHHYLHEKILPENPFMVLDGEGVGQLIRMATGSGRQTRPGLKVGICGEHGGDPQSIAFCHDSELNYVSASPYRVPIARLAAAQARIRERERKPGSNS
ncbi:MAG: pyruvate, phosphate dikinase, partial [Firmicutes bacterium]|nr:pyruvate, phosphate dikinase [Bacillota bacterium]